ncbi:GntR family transcriptional regulator [Streptomyces sp. NPDC051315]|uniref:GntR family transcriptional regulator n=1 Tax=Streptomyces sp. NPDC051315 TaxID=3365650 RepID=UPI0037A313B4
MYTSPPVVVGTVTTARRPSRPTAVGFSRRRGRPDHLSDGSVPGDRHPPGRLEPCGAAERLRCRRLGRAIRCHELTSASGTVRLCADDGAAHRREAVSDQLFTLLRDRILSGTLGAGTPLTAERELAAEFGVDRHAVREAVRRPSTQSLTRRQDRQWGRAGASRPYRSAHADP